MVKIYVDMIFTVPPPVAEGLGLQIMTVFISK